jgi:hypothetical protein
MSADSPQDSNRSDEPVSRQISEWGLAALGIGSVQVLAAPITLVLSVQLWESGQGSRDGPTHRLHAWLARVGVGIVLATAVVGVGCGIKAIRSAAARKQPAGLAVAGLWICLAASALWVITSIGLLNTTESLLRLFGQRH